MMVRRMCGVSLKDRKRSDELLKLNVLRTRYKVKMVWA